MAERALSVRLLRLALQDGTTVSFGKTDAIKLSFENRRAKVGHDNLAPSLKALPWDTLLKGSQPKVLFASGELTIGSGDSAITYPLDNVLRIAVGVKKP